MRGKQERRLLLEEGDQVMRLGSVGIRNGGWRFDGINGGD